MNTTLNATAMNSTEKMNSVFGDIYEFLEENWENNPYWLVFICTLMWVVYPFAYGYFIYNVWKWIGEEEELDEGYESSFEEEEIIEEEN